MNGDLRVLPVAEDQHQVAGRVQEIERAKQFHALLDRQADRRPLIGEFHELGPVADQRQAQENVVVVGGERRHDVGFVAEFDQPDQVVVLPGDPLAHERFGGRHGGEERRFVRRVPVQRRGGKTRHHARRGVDHHRDAAARIGHVLPRERRVRIRERHGEERQAGEEQHQRAVSHHRHPRRPRPLQHGRQRHLRPSRLPAGRGADDHQAERHADEDHKREHGRAAAREQQIGDARVAPLEDRVAEEDGHVAYRDHARLSTSDAARPRDRRFISQV